MPYSLSIQFSESHSIQMDINEYHDGRSQRTALAVSARRSWKIAKRLDPTSLVALRTFFDAAKGGAFFFYNPSETVPPYSPNPSGTVGRYLVRFNSDWSQTNNIARIDTAIELTEVASAADIAGAA